MTKLTVTEINDRIEQMKSVISHAPDAKAKKMLKSGIRRMEKKLAKALAPRTTAPSAGTFYIAQLAEQAEKLSMVEAELEKRDILIEKVLGLLAPANKAVTKTQIRTAFAQAGLENLLNEE